MNSIRQKPKKWLNTSNRIQKYQKKLHHLWVLNYGEEEEINDKNNNINENEMILNIIWWKY